MYRLEFSGLTYKSAANFGVYVVGLTDTEVMRSMGTSVVNGDGGDLPKATFRNKLWGKY